MAPSPLLTPAFNSNPSKAACTKNRGDHGVKDEGRGQRSKQPTAVGSRGGGGGSSVPGGGGTCRFIWVFLVLFFTFFELVFYGEDFQFFNVHFEVVCTQQYEEM